MRCLDIGHGPGRLGPDWVNVSATKLPDTDFVCDWGAERLPFSDGAFDLVHSSHCLEHIPWYRVVDALKEAMRVVKNGGIVEIWVPDFQYIVKCYHEETCGDEWRYANKEADFMKWVNGRLFAYDREGEKNFHKGVFDRSYLKKCFTQAGFEHIFNLDKPRLNAHPIQLQLGVGAIK